MSYVHTPIVFSQKQIDSLKRDLKIGNAEQEQRLLRDLNGAVGYFRFRQQQREATPDVRAARGDATSVSHHAKALCKFINKSPTAFLFDFGDVRDMENIKSEFVRVLNGIAQQADSILQDEGYMRRLYGLADSNSANQSIMTQHLWPTLFEVYDEYTGSLTFSPGGPLERYIGIVHEVCELARPSSATIRIAVSQWRRDKTQH